MDAHRNFAYGLVATAPSPASSGLTVTLQAGQGAGMPAAPFNAVVWPAGTIALASNAEVFRVTDVTGDVLTMVRAQEGSSARTILVGDQVAATITAKTLTDVEDAIPSVAGLISNINISAGTTSQNLSALTFQNSNGLSFGLSGSVVTGTVATNYQSQGAYLTTAALTQDSSKYAGTGAAMTGGSITVNTNGVSVSLPPYLTTAMQSNAATISNAKLSAGTLSALRSDVTFADSNGVSFGLNTNGAVTATVRTDYQSAGAYLTTAALSQDSSKYAGTNGALTGGSITLNTSGLSISLPVYLTTAMASNAATISNAKFSAGTLSALRSDLTFSDSNGVSWGLNTNGVITATVATNYQSAGAYLTTAALSGDSSKYAGVGFTTTTAAGATVVGTHDTSGLKLGVPAFLTTAMQSNAATISNINVSAGAASANLSNVVFSNSNNVTFGLNGSTITASMPSASVITLSAGANSQTFGSVVFSNSNRVSFGLNGSTVTAQHALNISAGSTSADIGDQVVFSNSNGYSFGLSASTVTVEGPYAGWIEPYGMTNTALFGPGAGSWYLAPFTAFNSVSGGRINFLMQNTSTASLFRDFTGASLVSSSTGGQQQGYSYSLVAAIFSQGSGTNSTRLESAWSNSFSFGWTKSVSVAVSNASNINVTVAHSLSYIGDIGTNGAYTLTSYVNSTNTSVANSSTASNFADTVFSSGRNLVSNSVAYPIGLNTTFSAGAYWLGFAWSSTRSNASTGTQIATALDFSQSSIVGISRLEMNSLYRNWGSTATTNRSAQIPYGLYTGAANLAPPATIAFSSDLSSLASQWVPYFNIQQRGLTK